MSTRWYPIYQRGCPQLRVFLPNFWMKLIRPTHNQPPNIVQFACSMEMTTHDIKNYLEKVYNIPVIEVRTRIALGPTRRDTGGGYVVKDEDSKLAYITIPKESKFEFPDLFPKEAQKDQETDLKALEQNKKEYKKYMDRNKDRPGLPGWFSF